MPARRQAAGRSPRAARARPRSATASGRSRRDGWISSAPRRPGRRRVRRAENGEALHRLDLALAAAADPRAARDRQELRVGECAPCRLDELGARVGPLDSRHQRRRVDDVGVERLRPDHDRQRLEVGRTRDADVQHGVGLQLGDAHRRPDPGLGRPDPAAEPVLSSGGRELLLGRSDDENQRRPKNQRSSGPSTSLRRNGALPDLVAVALGHADVVLERLVRRIEGVLELVPLEEVVVLARLVGRPKLRVDGAADRPHAALLALDPDLDALVHPGVVASLDHALGEASCLRLSAQRGQGYNRPGGRHQPVLPQRLLVPRDSLEPGGPRRRIRGPGARPRAVAERHPRRPVRPQPLLRGRGRARARPAGRAQGDRRRPGQIGQGRISVPASSATRTATARSHAASPFDLKRTMSSSACRSGQLAGDHLLELVHLEPVEQALGHGLDQVAGLDPRVGQRVAADERRPLENGVVELPRPRVVRAGGAHERARPEPLAAQHRIARGRDRDDHVRLGGLAVALGRFGADLVAELGQPLGRPAVRDRLLDARQGLADARDCVRAWSRSRSRPASAHPPWPGASPPLRSRRRCGADPAGRPRSRHAAHPVRRARPRSGRPRRRRSTSSRRRARARCPPRTSPPGTRLEPDPVTRDVLDVPAWSRRNESSTAAIASAGASSRSTSASVSERAGPESRQPGYCFGMKLILPLVSSTAQRTSESEAICSCGPRLDHHLVDRDPLTPHVPLDGLAVLDDDHRLALQRRPQAREAKPRYETGSGGPRTWRSRSANR